MVEMIEKLTDTIYREGVEKARKEADQIIAEATHEKERIINEGRSEVDRMIAGAKKMSAEFKQKTETEVKLASQKALASLRQRIEDLIVASLADDVSSKVTDDTDFIKKMVETIIAEWDPSDYTADSLIIKLAEKDRHALEKYFEQGAARKMKGKLSFEIGPSVKAGFYIEEVNGKFRVGFTEDDFREFFRYFLKKHMHDFLFGKQ
ncbi:MAG: hypothetical protein GF384_08555 [Elusimicrobia bacterium]|nr:hypothetical protein [Elusimicrobiota bacterium]MBD3412668.1 hypothetical protein [Elusimicrobiota bacterium]